MKNYTVTALNGERVTLTDDDTFTLALHVRGEKGIEETTEESLAACISLGSLARLYERRPCPKLAGAIRSALADSD